MTAPKVFAVRLDVEDSPLRCPNDGKRMVIGHEATQHGVEIVHACLACGRRESDEMLRPGPDMSAAIDLAQSEPTGYLEPREV